MRMRSLQQNLVYYLLDEFVLHLSQTEWSYQNLRISAIWLAELFQ